MNKNLAKLANINKMMTGALTAKPANQEVSNLSSSRNESVKQTRPSTFQVNEVI